MASEEAEVEVDLEKLESEVRLMALKISEYRQTHTTLVSSPALLPIISETDVPAAVLGTEEHDSGDKMIQLKERMSRNATNIPKVVKRVQECIEGIHKVDSLDTTIHPAFTRPRF